MDVSGSRHIFIHTYVISHAESLTCYQDTMSKQLWHVIHGCSSKVGALSSSSPRIQTPSVCFVVSLFRCFFVSLFVCLFVCLFVYLFIYLFVSLLNHNLRFEMSNKCISFHGSKQLLPRSSRDLLSAVQSFLNRIARRSAGFQDVWIASFEGKES